MNDPEIKRAVKNRDFLALMQRLHPRYHKLVPDAIKPTYTEADIMEAATAAGCVREYERDKALAPVAIGSRFTVKAYGLRVGVVIEADDDLEIWVTEGKEKPIQRLVSSPLMVVSEGYNHKQGGACLELLIKSTTGQWKTLFVPRAELIGGKDLQPKMQSMGLLPGKFSTILHMLQNIDPPEKFFRVEHAGWNGDYYALPSGKVIPSDDSAVATFPPLPDFKEGGSLEGADALLVALEEQALFVFAISVALAAPFVAHYGPDAEPGGFHFYGPSSRGKTTLLATAATVWGVGAEKKDGGIVETWNTTGFAGEQTAAQHSDCAMYMDEIKSADPEHVQSLIFQFTNGAGRKAGTSSGGLRESKTFRPMVLSSGEISTKEYLTSNRLTYHGGLSVRMIDVPADTASGFGIFTNVPPQFSGDAAAFARWLKQQSTLNHGFHGPRLIQHYVQDRDGILADVRQAASVVRTELEARGADGDPQTGRVCDRLAFVAGIGIVACNRHLLPWQEGSVKLAVISVFDAWFAARGGEGSMEGLAAEQAFSSFFYAHQNRFQGMGAGPERDRLGLRVLDEDRHLVLWVAYDDGLVEMLGGQPERVPQFLERLITGLSEDWELVPSGDGRRKRDAPAGYGLPKRAYCFRAKRPLPDDPEEVPDSDSI